MEDFNTSVHKFHAFLIENGCYLEAVWVFHEDVLEDKRNVWIHWPLPKCNLPKIEEEYERGMKLGFGVMLDIYYVTMRHVCCTVFIAEDSQTATDLIMSGLKLSMTRNPRTAKLIRRQ